MNIYIYKYMHTHSGGPAGRATAWSTCFHGPLGRLFFLRPGGNVTTFSPLESVA